MVILYNLIQVGDVRCEQVALQRSETIPRLLHTSDAIHPAQPSRAPPPTPVSHPHSGPLHSRAAQVDDAEWQRLAAADFSSPAALEALPVAERWVVSSLHATVEAITAAQERCVCWVWCGVVLGGVCVACNAGCCAGMGWGRAASGCGRVCKRWQEGRSARDMPGAAQLP